MTQVAGRDLRSDGIIGSLLVPDRLLHSTDAGAQRTVDEQDQLVAYLGGIPGPNNALTTGSLRSTVRCSRRTQ